MQSNEFPYFSLVGQKVKSLQNRLLNSWAWCRSQKEKIQGGTSWGALVGDWRESKYKYGFLDAYEAFTRLCQVRHEPGT